MFDFTQNSLTQSLNATGPFPDDPLDSSSPLSDASLTTRQGASQSLLSAQKLIEQQTATNLSTTSQPKPMTDFDDQATWDQHNSLAPAPKTESDSYQPQEQLQKVDSLLAGGLLDQASLNSAEGAFTVGDSGLVSVDFLFDGGEYTGELAIFSLVGMGNLTVADFAEEAARRAISGTSQGQIVIADSVEGAQFFGELGESDRNQGNAATTKTLTLPADTRFAFMLVPNGTVAAVAASDTSSDSSNTPLFSIAAYNPGGTAQIAQATDGVFAIEDLQIGKGDADFNDIVFRVEGASSAVLPLLQLANPNKNWLTNPTAAVFLNTSQGTEPSVPTEPDPINPVEPPTGSTVIADISEEVNKFTRNASEAEIIATGANSVTFGSQTVYIGTDQVSGDNQDPIVRSFDPINPENNWIRQDFETTGTDGRGLGLIWTGTALYGVFSVDGTQGTAAEDFRRATGNVKQEWLRSFGSGEGKVAVIGQIDPATGALLKAAYLSAINNGKTNSLFVTGATVNSTGNLVISAKSFFRPRRPNGNPLTKDQGNTQGSPFDYTVEITADLTEVINTAAEGWS